MVDFELRFMCVYKKKKMKKEKEKKKETWRNEDFDFIKRRQHFQQLDSTEKNKEKRIYTFICLL